MEIVEKFASGIFDYFYKNGLHESLYDECVDTNLSLPLVSVASNILKSEMRLFNWYIQHGVFLIGTSRDDDVVLDAINISHSVALRSKQQTFENYGGYVFSSRGTGSGAESLNIVKIDFQSFYPSIVAAFKLTFSTVDIINEAEMGSLARHVNNCNDIMTRFKCDKSNHIILILKSIMTDTVEYSAVGGLYSMCAKAISDRERATGGSRVLLKKSINTLIGCLNNKSFEYYSPILYNTITYLGRRIILFVTAYISEIATGGDTIYLEKLFYSYDMTHQTPSECIKSIQSDGFSFTTKHDPRLIVYNINALFQKITQSQYVKCRVDN